MIRGRQWQKAVTSELTTSIPATAQRLLAEAENNYSAVSTPASEELRRLLPSDYARRGMSQAAALAVLSVVRKRRLG